MGNQKRPLPDQMSGSSPGLEEKRDMKDVALEWC